MPRQLAQSLVQLDHDAERVVERGRQAWKSLRNDETFEKWIARNGLPSFLACLFTISLSSPSSFWR